MNLREQAIEAYETSDLWMADKYARTAENKSLRELLHCLSIDVEPTGSTVEVDGIIIDAIYEEPILKTPFMGKDLSTVSFRAHEKCSRCGQMRHSDRIGGRSNVESAAAELGRWLSHMHECPPSDKGQIGFRASVRTGSAAAAQEENR